MSKIVGTTNVSPLLINLGTSDVQGPLVQFQATNFTRPDILRLLGSMNQRSPEDTRLSEKRLSVAFDQAWTGLETGIGGLLDKYRSEDTPSLHEMDKQMQVLDELLDLVRSQHRSISAFNQYFEKMQRRYIGWRISEIEETGNLEKRVIVREAIRGILSDLYDSKENPAGLLRVLYDISSDLGSSNK